jgi:hypothetical protein
MQREQVLSLPALRGRGVIRIGRPEHSEFIESRAPELQETGVTTRDSRETFLPWFNEKGELSSAYGLVTVLPSKRPDLSPRRTIIVSANLTRISHSGTNKRPVPMA